MWNALLIFFIIQAIIVVDILNQDSILNLGIPFLTYKCPYSKRYAGNTCNRGNVTGKIKTQALEKHDVDRVHWPTPEERVPVGRRIYYLPGSDIAAFAW